MPTKTDPAFRAFTALPPGAWRLSLSPAQVYELLRIQAVFVDRSRHVPPRGSATQTREALLRNGILDPNVWESGDPFTDAGAAVLELLGPQHVDRGFDLVVTEPRAKAVFQLEAGEAPKRVLLNRLAEDGLALLQPPALTAAGRAVCELLRLSGHG